MYGLAIDTALKVLAGQRVACVTQINSQIGVSHGDETPSIPHPDAYIDQMVAPNAPADKLITSGLGKDYAPKPQ